MRLALETSNAGTSSSWAAGPQEPSWTGLKLSLRRSLPAGDTDRLLHGCIASIDETRCIIAMVGGLCVRPSHWSQEVWLSLEVATRRVQGGGGYKAAAGAGKGGGDQVVLNCGGAAQARL